MFHKIIRIGVFSILFIFNLNTNIFSKEVTPLEISEIVFGNSGFDYTKILPFCCDMHEVNFRDSSLGQMLPPMTERKYDLLFQNDTMAVVAVSFNFAEEFQDIYVYFTKLENWHIETLRKLVKTEVINQSLSEIESLPPEEALTIIKKSGYDDLEKYIKRTKLILSSDSKIEQYFNENKNQFQKIVDYIFDNQDTFTSEEINNLNKDEFINNALRTLLIDKIVPAEEEGEFIGFLIGGLIDNTVGFCYQPDKDKLPPMSKNLYIMIKPLGNGWYIYKTT